MWSGMRDLISDGNVPHLEMKGAGKPEPILRMGTLDCLKFRHLLRQLFLSVHAHQSKSGRCP